MAPVLWLIVTSGVQALHPPGITGPLLVSSAMFHMVAVFAQLRVLWMKVSAVDCGSMPPEHSVSYSSLAGKSLCMVVQGGEAACIAVPGGAGKVLGGGGVLHQRHGERAEGVGVEVVAQDEGMQASLGECGPEVVGDERGFVALA